MAAAFGRREVASAAFWRVTEIALSEGASFAVFLFLAHLVAPEAFGTVALASVCVALGMPLLSQGLVEALVQQPRLTRAMLDSAFWLNVAFGGALALLAVFLAPLLGDMLGDPRFAEALSALSPIFVLAAASAVLQAQLRRELRFRAFTLRTVLAVLGGGTLGITLAALGYGFWALVGQQVAYNAIALIVLASRSDWRPRLSCQLTHVRRLLVFGRHTTACAVTDFLIGRADVFVVGLFLPSASVALYYFAKRLVFAAGMFTYYSIQQVGLPVIARGLTAEPTEAMRARVAAGALMTAMLVCGPTLAGLALVAPEVTALAGGTAWQGAAPLLALLAMGAIFHGLRITAGQVLVGSGRPDAYVPLTFANACTTLLLIALGAQGGLTAAAAGAALAPLLALPLSLGKLARTLAITRSALLEPLYRAALPTLAMISFVLLFGEHVGSTPIERLVARSGLGALGFAAAAILVFPASARAQLRRLAQALASPQPGAPQPIKVDSRCSTH
jgi:PST family polysaccharide transporter